MFVWIGAAVFAQAPASPTFEVASVKPNRSGENHIMIGFQPGGRFTAMEAPLSELIALAYGTPQPLPSNRMTGGPQWIETERFDVIAKAGRDLQIGSDDPAPAMIPMLRGLLADRFKLVVHTERRDMPTYELAMARNDHALGPRLHASTTDCAALMAAVRARGGQPLGPSERSCVMRMFPGTVSGSSATMAQFVNVLARFVGRTVVDRTGLTGNYDLELQWAPDQMPFRCAADADRRFQRPVHLHGCAGATRVEARIGPRAGRRAGDR